MAEQKRKQLLATSRPPSFVRRMTIRQHFTYILQIRSLKNLECMEKNGYLDQKEKEEGEEAEGATHGNDEEEFNFGK